MGRVFVSGPGDLRSIPGHVIPKTSKMVLDTSMQYKVCIKGKVEQSRKRSSVWVGAEPSTEMQSVNLSILNNYRQQINIKIHGRKYEFHICYIRLFLLFI